MRRSIRSRLLIRGDGTTAVALCAALTILASACTQRGPGVVPPGVRDQCITVGMGDDVWPSSGTVEAFLQSAVARGFLLDGWRKSGGQYKLSASTVDPQSGQRHGFEFIMGHADTTSSKCPRGSMVVTEVTLDGERLARGIVGNIVFDWSTPRSQP